MSVRASRAGRTGLDSGDSFPRQRAMSISHRSYLASLGAAGAASLAMGSVSHATPWLAARGPEAGRAARRSPGRGATYLTSRAPDALIRPACSRSRSAGRSNARTGPRRGSTHDAMRAMGYAVVPSHANFFHTDSRRAPATLQRAMRGRGVAVGRPFPPLETHTRISIGTMDTLRQAMAIAVDVLRHA